MTEDKYFINQNGNTEGTKAEKSPVDGLADTYVANPELSLQVCEDFASVDRDSWSQ
jgi:hypothetical protein